MFKNIIEDIILIALLGIALYFVYTKWLSGLIASGSEAVKKTAAAYVADTKTIGGAVTSPWETVKDLFKSTTPYISQEQFRANIETIKRNLEGKP